MVHSSEQIALKGYILQLTFVVTQLLLRISDCGSYRCSRPVKGVTPSRIAGSGAFNKILLKKYDHEIPPS